MAQGKGQRDVNETIICFRNRWMVELELSKKWKRVSLSVLDSFVLVDDSGSLFIKYLLSGTEYKCLTLGSLLTPLWLIVPNGCGTHKIKGVHSSFFLASEPGLGHTYWHHSCWQGEPAEELQLAHIHLISTTYGGFQALLPFTTVWQHSYPFQRIPTGDLYTAFLYVRLPRFDIFFLCLDLFFWYPWNWIPTFNAQINLWLLAYSLWW